MTSSDPATAQADALVERLAAALSAEQIAQRIDGPIDRAVESFPGVWRPPFAIRRFHEVLGQFICHVYRTCGYCDGRLSPAPAAEEAIQLLESGYQGAFETGYDGALLDAVHAPEPPRQGIETVLLGLAAIIKGQRRMTYVAWTLHRHIDPLDPALRRLVVRAIQRRHAAWLPNDLSSCPPYELTDHIVSLLQVLDDVETAIPQRRPPETARPAPPL